MLFSGHPNSSSAWLQQGTPLSHHSLSAEITELFTSVNVSGAGIFTGNPVFSPISDTLLCENTSWQKWVQVKRKQAGRNFGDN